MTIPATSTSDAMNGPDDTAGSNPNRLMSRGSKAPATDPNVTHAIKARPTATAIPPPPL
jgi:hypothetical protein